MSKRPDKDKITLERSAVQPELELFIAIDKCAYFSGQLECLKQLDNIGKLADGRVRVTLLVTDMDYAEKTDYRDPAHIDQGLKKSNIGYKFAQHIIANRNDVRIIHTDAFKGFIEVFNKEILLKEILDSSQQVGLLGMIEKALSTPSHETRVLLSPEMPLGRLRELHSSTLYEMYSDLKKGVYRSMKMTEGGDKLSERGIDSADDLTLEHIRIFLSQSSPALALQALHDSPSVYHQIIRSSPAFNEAKNNAGEISVFDAWEQLQNTLKKAPTKERAEFGKRAAMLYVSNDGDALDLLNKIRRRPEPDAADAGNIPLRVMHSHTFVRFLKAIADDLTLPKKPRQNTKTALAVIEQLKEAKSALRKEMPNIQSHEARTDEGFPDSLSMRNLFVTMIGDKLKRSKHQERE